MAARRNAVLVAAGLVVGAVVGPPGLAAADKIVQDVFVTNTASNPVPTAAQGTTNVAGTVNVGNSVAVASSDASPIVVDDRSQPYQVTKSLHNTDCGVFQDVVARAPGTPFRLEGVTIGQDYFHDDEPAVTLWGLVRGPSPDDEHLVALAQATNLETLNEVENIATDILIHPNTRAAASPGQVYAVLAEMCVWTIEFPPVWVILTGTTI